MPGFTPEGGVLLNLTRGVWDAALLSGFGTLAFWVAVLPRTLRSAPAEVAAPFHRLLLRLSRAELAAAALALSVWLWRQSMEITGSTGAAPVQAVALGTVFGHLVLLQYAGLGAAAIALGNGAAPARRWLATGLLGVAAGMQAGHGHAFAQQGGSILLLGSSMLHILAAGAWLGGLLPLLLVIRSAPCRTGAAAARWFSPLGKWCIGLLAGSAVLPFYALIGGWSGLTATSYGWVSLCKAALLAVLIGFACINRYRLAPPLVGAAGAASRPILVGSIAVQTAFGLLVVLAASLLSGLPPATHL